MPTAKAAIAAVHGTTYASSTQPVLAVDVAMLYDFAASCSFALNQCKLFNNDGTQFLTTSHGMLATTQPTAFSQSLSLQAASMQLYYKQGSVCQYTEQLSVKCSFINAPQAIEVKSEAFSLQIVKDCTKVALQPI